MKKAVFLDRDGTLTADSKNYIKSIAEFSIFPFTAKALKVLQQAGFLLIVITNQSGLSRGYFSEKTLKAMHDHLREQLEINGVTLDDIYYCPHLPEDNCDCRKPKPKLLQKAAKKHQVDLKNSWFIGDSEKDILTGQKKNCNTALVLSGVRGITEKAVKMWQTQPDIIAENILFAAGKIIEMESDK